MDKLQLYIKESYNELLNKVTWPSLSSLQQSTVVVLVASLILALVIFLLDSVFNFGLSSIYGTK